MCPTFFLPWKMLPDYSETFYPETNFFHDADPVDWHLMIVYLVLSNFPPPKKQPFEKKTTQRSAAHQVASRLSNILKQKNSKQQKNDKNIPPPPPMNEIAPIFFYFNENIWHAGSPPFPPIPVPHAPPTSLVSTLRSADSQTLDDLEKKNILTIFTT